MQQEAAREKVQNEMSATHKKVQHERVQHEKCTRCKDFNIKKV